MTEKAACGSVARTENSFRFAEPTGTNSEGWFDAEVEVQCDGCESLRAHHFSPIKMHVFEESPGNGCLWTFSVQLPCNPCRRPSTKSSCAFSSLGRHGYIDCSGCRIVSGMFRSAEHGQKDWIPLAKLLNRLSRPRVVKNDRRFITAWFATNKRKSESHCRFPRAAIFAQC